MIFLDRYLSISILTVVVMMSSILLASQNQLTLAQEAPKVGLVLGATIDDLGWGALHNQALQYLKDKKGFEVAISEEVPPSEWENAARSYAEGGYKYVIMGGPQFTEVTVKVAPDYPDTMFIVTAAVPSDKPIPSNVIGIDPKNEQSGYLAGILAGGMTKSNKIGIVAGQDFPNLVRMYEAFKLAAAKENPNIQILQAYTGNFIDVAKGFEAAKGQTDSGADIIFQDLDRGAFGVVNAAKEKSGVFLIGNTNDQSFIAPEIVLTSALMNHSSIITQVIEDIDSGKLKGGEFLRWGVNEAVAGIAPYHGTNDKIPSDLKGKIEQVRQQIINGTLEVPEIYEADGYKKHLGS
jgi:basic membrane protein A